MSICSTTASWPAPERTVSWKGYRFTTTRSNGSIPSSDSCCTCSGLRRSARIPACTRGCRVLTRPSRHSWKPVTSATSVTGTPAAWMVFAVEPVETMSTPASCSPRASSSRPVLSYTEIRARLSGTRFRSEVFTDSPGRRGDVWSGAAATVRGTAGQRPVQSTAAVTGAALCGGPAQRARSARQSTSSCRSAVLMRSCRVSSVSWSSTATATWARIGPASTSATTSCTVAPVSFTP